MSIQGGFAYAMYFSNVVGHCLKFCKKAKACIQNLADESADHSMGEPWVYSRKMA